MRPFFGSSALPAKGGGLTASNKYESVSNKYALALLEFNRLDETESVLRGSLRVYPDSPTSNVHLGRILLNRKDYPKAKTAYLEALASDRSTRKSMWP